jgi:tetratricopeptide (TPR) repeat protein
VSAAAARAEQLRVLGRVEEAERVAREGLAEEPGEPLLLGALSATLLRAHRHEEGLAAAEAACAAAPRAERGHRLRALHLSYLGRHPEAIEAGHLAVSLEPHEPTAVHGYATVLQRAHRLPEALAAARRVVELNPDDAGAHLLLADIASDAGDRKLARAEYGTTLRIDPQNAAAQHDLALLDARTRRPARALAGLMVAGRLDPSMPEVMRTVVVVLWQLSWRLRIWLVVATIPALLVSADPAAARITAAAVLATTAALGWWTVRDLPAGTFAVVRRAVRSDRPLTLTYAALALCLLTYLAVLVSGIGPLAALVWLVLIALGWMTLVVRLVRRTRRHPRR